MPPPTASGGISREQFNRRSRNFTYLSGTIGPTNLRDMTSLAVSDRLQNAIEYCSTVWGKFLWRGVLPSSPISGLLALTSRKLQGNNKIDLYVALDSLYISIGNCLTIYFRSAENRVHFVAMFGSRFIDHGSIDFRGLQFGKG